MKYLVVYRDFAGEANELLRSLGAREAEVFSVGTQEVDLAPLERKLAGDADAEVGVCRVRPSLVRRIKRLATLTFEARDWRRDDQALALWLVPPPQPEVDRRLPSQVFLDVAEQSGGLLLLHPTALSYADELTAVRHGFVQRAGSLLLRYFQGDQSLGPNREWLSRHRVEFAPNGQVIFTCEISRGRDRAVMTSQWHLKEGDNTDRANCARIYFIKFNEPWFSGGVLLYCGPHPQNGHYIRNLELNHA